jgi:hypothetical protein
MWHRRGDCFLILQTFVLCADIEHLIILLAILWGMAVIANMHQGIAWHYHNCRNKYQDTMTCRHTFCITDMHHTIGGHTVGSWSQEEPGVKIYELYFAFRVIVYSQMFVLKFFGRMKLHKICFLEEGKRSRRKKILKLNEGVTNRSNIINFPVIKSLGSPYLVMIETLMLRQVFIYQNFLNLNYPTNLLTTCSMPGTVIDTLYKLSYESITITL